MEFTRRLILLKSHRLDLSGGPVFESQQHCIDWISKIAPLLRYDAEHYRAFQHYGYYLGLRSLSNDMRMQFIGEVNGIVNRAIIELENGISQGQSEDPTPKESKPKFDPIEPSWHKSTLGKIALGSGIPLIVILIVFALKHWFGIEVK